MSTDKELLELAAKAAGFWNYEFNCYEGPMSWNPLDKDGDALRLMVKCGLHIYFFLPNDDIGKPYTEVNRSIKECHDNDSYAATRHAVVRAAAEIGRKM